MLAQILVGRKLKLKNYVVVRAVRDPLVRPRARKRFIIRIEDNRHRAFPQLLRIALPFTRPNSFNHFADVGAPSDGLEGKLLFGQWILQMALMNSSQHVFEVLDRIGLKIEMHSVFGSGAPHGLLGHDLHSVIKVTANFSLSKVGAHRLHANYGEDRNDRRFQQSLDHGRDLGESPRTRAKWERRRMSQTMMKARNAARTT